MQYDFSYCIFLDVYTYIKYPVNMLQTMSAFINESLNFRSSIKDNTLTMFMYKDNSIAARVSVDLTINRITYIHVDEYQRLNGKGTAVLTKLIKYLSTQYNLDYVDVEVKTRKHTSVSTFAALFKKCNFEPILYGVNHATFKYYFND